MAENKDFEQAGLTEEEKKRREENEKQVKAKENYTKIIRGENDTFKKHYKLGPEYGDVEFDVEVHIPNALEEGAISGLMARYLNGVAEFVPKAYYDIYYLFALIVVCSPKGYKVPDVLDIEKSYNLDIPLMVSEDYAEFRNSFRTQ